MLHLRNTIYILIILFCTETHAYAQGYDGHKPLQDYYAARAIGGERLTHRLSVGIGRHIVPGKVVLNYQGVDTFGKPINTTLEQGILSRKSFIVHLGTFFPITLISDQSIIALHVDLMCSYVSLTNDSVNFTGKTPYKKGYDIYRYGVPISIDYKTGGDVSLSKRQSFTFTTGIGLNLNHTTILVDNADVKIFATPFIKVEIGFFAGIAFKLRGVAQLGSAKYIDSKTAGIYGNDHLHSQTKSGYGYYISLVCLPFSWDWRSEEWY